MSFFNIKASKLLYAYLSSPTPVSQNTSAILTIRMKEKLTLCNKFMKVWTETVLYIMNILNSFNLKHVRNSDKFLTLTSLECFPLRYAVHLSVH